ncbi:YafY family transcriptional regulator [Nocardioides sp. KC13]|uniref:YafY family transcriptional regulator n=1 Tax=Nocardioides turkmenicus TaxID=2711220 RepID=A0A6M1QUT2_9ACTN|nr:YafY family protein [Nocardioides sp. KC13]NGN93635.1 YafY family transcriptional regulator [Nocardioides sp. KC13]
MSTSARMLQLLSLLQTHRFWPGTELSVRLEVSERTLRRDIERLRDLGYDVDATRGVAGGYQLRAGNALPPLLLDDEEAVAIAVGLRTAAAGLVAGMGDTSAQALGKVVALMPPRLRRRMDAVASQTDSLPWGGRVPLDAGVLGVLAQACRDDEALTFTYQAPEAEPTRRRVEPHRLVTIGNRWYLLAYDRVRHDWRSFRVDRISESTTTGQIFRPREIPGGDAASYVQAGIRSRSAVHDICVLIHVEPEVVARRVGRWGEVEPAEGGCRLRMQADDLGWPMMILAGVEAEFTVEQPAELAEMVRQAGERFVRSSP